MTYKKDEKVAKKKIDIIQTIGTKYLPLLQIQFVKCVIFCFPYVGSILLGSTIWHF